MKNQNFLDNEDEETNENQMNEDEDKEIDERLVSKDWKTRKDAYIELLVILEANKGKLDFANNFDSFYLKIFDDTNQNCQESGIEVIKYLIENFDLEQSQIIEYFKNLIEKLFLSKKPQCKNKSKDLILNIFENYGNQAQIYDALKNLIENNKKKIVVLISTLENINSIISEFGTGFKWVELIPSILKCLEMTNPAIKNWVMEILKNLYKFVKDDLKTQLTGIKENLIKDINTQLNKIEIETLLEPKRKIKAVIPKSSANVTKQAKPQIQVKKEEVHEEEEEEEEEVDIPYLETENKIKTKLSKKFENSEISLNDIFNDGLSMFFDIKEVNCDRKKKILDFIIKNLNNKNLTYSDIENINDFIKSQLSSNVNIFLSTIPLVELLTVKLGKNFLGCKDHFPLICDKFKEKKDKVKKDILSCLDSMILNTNNLGEYLEFLKNVQFDKSNLYRQGVSEFIFNSISKTSLNILRSFSKELIELLIPLSDDTSIEVKNSILSSLALLKIRLGSVYDKLTDKLNEGKKKKIEELSSTVTYDKSYDNGEIIENKIDLSEKKRVQEYKKKNSNKKSSFEEDFNKMGEVNELNESLNESNMKKVYDTERINSKNILNENEESKESEIQKKSEKPVKTVDKKKAEEVKNVENNFEEITTNEKKIEENKVEIKTEPKKEVKKIVKQKEKKVEVEEDEEKPIETITPEVKMSDVDIDKLPFDERPTKMNKNSMFNEDKEAEFERAQREINEKREKLNNQKKKKPSTTTKDTKKPKIEATEVIDDDENQAENTKNQDEEKSGKINLEDIPLNSLPKNNFEEQMLNAKEQKEAIKKVEKKPVVKKTEPKKDAKNQDNKGGQPDDDEETKIPKEEVEQKMNEFFHEQEIETLFSSPKWEDRKEAFVLIGNALKDKSDSINEISRYYISFVKYKLKDWKENNFNIVKEAINTIIEFYSITKKFDKKDCRLIIKGLHEKRADAKVQESVNNLFLMLMEHLTPNFVLIYILKLLKSAKSPKLMSDSASFFERCIEEFGISLMPVKDIVEFAKVIAVHTNPDVRKSATALLCSLYKYVGKELLVLLKDIKEATLKVITDAFENVQIVQNPKNDAPKRVLKGEADSGKAGAGGSQLELVPRTDISKKITAKILKDINTGKWAEKKEAMEALEKILADANNKILPAGLSDLFVAIKAKLNDGNKNFVRLIVSFLTKLIEAIGNNFKNFTKNIAAPLISSLADKQAAVRDDVSACIDKWVLNTGWDNFSQYVPTHLKQDNFEIRTEILKIIQKNKEAFQKSADLKEYVNPLLLCLQDKTNSIRVTAEEIMSVSLKSININNYYNGLKDFKPAIVNSLRLILDKYKGTVIETSADPKRVNAKNSVIESKRNDNSSEKFDDVRLETSPSVKKISTLGKTNSKTSANNTNNNTNNNSKTVKNDSNKNSKVVSNQNLNMKDNKSINDMSNKNVSPSNFNARIVSVFSNINNSKLLKEKRQELDKKLKLNVDQLNEDSIIKIKDQLKSLISNDLMEKMFSDDIKVNIEALNMMQNSLQFEFNFVFDTFDLILKWIFIKSNSQQNPAFIKKLIDFFESVYSHLIDTDLKLSDIESELIITTLIDKFSIAKLKDNLKSIIEKFEVIITPKKSFSLLLSTSLSKNQKIKCECIDLCTNIINNFSINDVPFKDIKSIAKILESQDNSLKSSALTLLTEAYKQAKDNLWEILGDLPQKTRDLLENKFETITEEVTSNLRSTKSQTNLNKSKDRSFDNDLEMKDIHETKHNSNYNNKDDYKTDSNVNGSNFNLNKQLDILENGEIKDRINTLIVLNELISTKYEASKHLLIKNLDHILKSFINCLQSAFDKNLDEIPLKFGKYLLTVLYKICCVKEIIFKVSYEVLFELCDEVLSKLLIDNLDKIGENNEGKLILKSLNGTMLRVLENCSPTDIFSVLIELVRKYRISPTTPRIAGLAIKCLLKLTQIINQIINDLNLEVILLKIHEFISDMERTNPELIPKHQNDELSLRIIKTVINELVKIKKDDILEVYTQAMEKNNIKETHIKKWISIIMKSLSNPESVTPSNSIPKECIPVIDELKKQFNEGNEFNPIKLQNLFILLNKNKFEFSNLANLLENRFYTRLLKAWKIYNLSEKQSIEENISSSTSKLNSIDNLIEYKNKLQEITKKYKHNDPNEKNETTSPSKKKNSKDMNSEIYNKMSNIKSKNERASTIKTTQDDEQTKNPLDNLKQRWLEEMDKKRFQTSSNNNNENDFQSNDTHNLSGISNNDTLSKLAEIKTKLNKNKNNFQR